MNFRDRIFASRIAAVAYNWVTNQEIWAQHASALLDFVEKPLEELNVLDLGCGPGTTTAAMSQNHPSLACVVGLDISKSMLKYAKGCDPHANLCFVQGDGGELPFMDASFDLVTGHSFLYLVPNRDLVVGEISRVLRPGGRLVFLEPNAGFEPLTGLTAALGNSLRILESPNATLRFCASMVGWRVASGLAGRLSRGSLEPLFKKHKLQARGFHERFGSLGLLCVAEKVARIQK